LAGEIVDVHNASCGIYGAHRVTAELNTAAASRSGITRSSWSMRELGIRGTPTRRLPKGARVVKVTSLDLVGRVFAPDRPNALWVTDIERHEALHDRAVMKGHRRQSVAADWLKLRAA
jgi:transposase InsO family protein